MEVRSLSDGGEGRSGTTAGEFPFFLFDGGTSGVGRAMGTGSFSRALYTKYIAWKTKQTTLDILYCKTAVKTITFCRCSFQSWVKNV